jgi:hypothetical protein
MTTTTKPQSHPEDETPKPPTPPPIPPSPGFWKRTVKQFGLFWVFVSTILISLIGFFVGLGLLNAAQQNSSCGGPASTDSWQGIAITGLSSSLTASYGYGRGTQTIDSTLTATPPSGGSLPSSIAVFAAPLATSDGTQKIPSVPSTDKRPPNAGISAEAVRIPSSSTYRLEVCVKAPHAGAGSYSSQLLFPDAKLAAGTSLPVTVTFQSRIVPLVLTVGIAPLTLLGLLYTTLVLVRRTNPAVELSGLPEGLRTALCSVNGLAALIFCLGAVFTAWYAQCYRDPTWGSPWPTILVALATMASAAAGAATVPMGLAAK